MIFVIAVSDCVIQWTQEAVFPYINIPTSFVAKHNLSSNDIDFIG